MDLTKTVTRIINVFTENEQCWFLFLIYRTIPKGFQPTESLNLLVKRLLKVKNWNTCLMQCFYVLKRIDLLLTLFRVTEQSVERSLYTSPQLEAHILTLVTLIHDLKQLEMRGA
ncbi:orf 71; similar to family of FLIP proteins [Ateline gammaherpesvirus 3]|uniref:Similar to family of FLIP proteins n=1 Tax=Ateline herpesvirus 3 TaxID=85618 RepID=Q9YTJ5_ATHV3|nr:orf 71; similar to family of FLIP proteins [Ateline gammaherpesvirus 3]AAC95596.1 orf 71; similar to family of FLIP proteins [Ateline gammaherpesvirus 3]